jgi:hypothetical protein
MAHSSHTSFTPETPDPLSTSKQLEPLRARCTVLDEPGQRAPTTMASYLWSLRVETDGTSRPTVPDVGGYGIGRITQNRDIG